MNIIQNEEFRLLIEFDRICTKFNIKYSLAYGTLLGAIRHSGFIPWDDDIDVMMHRDQYDVFISVVKNELAKDMIYVDHDQEEKYYSGYGKIRSKVLLYPEKSTDYLGIHQGVWIDIFPFDAVGDESLESRTKLYKSMKKFHNFFVLSVYTHPVENGSGLKNMIRSLLYRINKATKNITFFRNYMFKKMVKKGTQRNNPSAILHNSNLANLTKREYHNGMLTKDQLNDCILVDFEGSKFPVIADYDLHLKGVYGDYMTLPPVEERVSNHSMV